MLSQDHRGRVTRLQRRARDRDLDALVVTRDGAVTYLAGPLLPWRSAVVVPTEGGPTLVTSEYDAERARTAACIDDVQTWRKGANPRSFTDAVGDALTDGEGAGTVGVELDTADVPGVLSAVEYRDLDRALAADLENCIDLVNDQMLAKRPPEVERLRRAAEIADVGMAAAVDTLEAGVAETTVAGAAERAMRAAGDEFTWSVTGTEVGSGRRQSYVDGLTAMTSRKRVQRGDVVTLDVHPTYDGYLGDLCRPAIVGTPTPEQRDLAAAWEAVASELLAALGPDVAVATVAERAVAAAREHGVEKWLFDSYFGHGLGTSARVPPLVSTASNRTLEPGHAVVALVYLGQPGVGGFRLETPVLITDAGSERLAKAPVEVQVVDA